MLQKILVPLDGSPLAEAALPFATVLGARAGADVTLVHAAVYRTLLGDVGAEQVRVIRSGEDYLARTAMALRATGVSVSTRVPLGGSPARWIVGETELLDADLIVMATHDREGLERWMHRSIAEDVVHGSAVPVMLVRGSADSRLAQRFEAREPTLLVPLDGSELADAGLPVACELAEAVHARVVLVAVVPMSGQPVVGQGGAAASRTAAKHAALEAEALAFLEARAGCLRDVAVVETVVRHGAAADEISQVAEQFAAAAVVMASHGRTGPVRSMFGSVAGGVLHRTTVPVVVLRPAGSRPASHVVAGDVAVGPAS
jgi:nucleotide-binding universal stress UspA family protein